MAADPGVWHLRLADGKGKDLFELVKSAQGDSEELVKVNDLPVVVTTFYDTAKQVRTRKQAGKEHLKLLDEIEMDQKDSGETWISERVHG